uniref:Uncharacterized protein n=1 Tax=Burkholderia cenocepacia TaxID=95486 RepID=A0A071M817_9BURK
MRSLRLTARCHAPSASAPSARSRRAARRRSGWRAAAASGPSRISARPAPCRSPPGDAAPCARRNRDRRRPCTARRPSRPSSCGRRA